LTIRTFLRRFTRLSPVGFSKKRENLTAAVAMHVANYNFVWRLREKGKSGRRLPTPAMQCGIVDRLWSFETLFDAVTEQDESRKRMDRYRRLAERMRST